MLTRQPMINQESDFVIAISMWNERACLQFTQTLKGMNLGSKEDECKSNCFRRIIEEGI